MVIRIIDHKNIIRLFHALVKILEDFLGIRSITLQTTCTMVRSMGLQIKVVGHCIAEPIFYGDLVYKFKRIVGKPNLSDQFKKDYQVLCKGWIYLGCHATVCMPGFKPKSRFIAMVSSLIA